MKEKILFMTNDRLGCIGENSVLSFYESQYVQQYNKNKQSIKARKEWKTQGTGAKFMGMAQDLSHLEEDQTFQRPIGICRSKDKEHFIYAMEVDRLCGIYSKSITDQEEIEGHIMHTQDIELGDLDYNDASQKIVGSLREKSASRHLAVLEPDTARYRVLTEGDCIDAHPSWSQKNPNMIVYESCGIGIDNRGVMVGISEYSICKLNLNTYEIEEAISLKGFDCIRPKEDKEGNIYFIKRPKGETGSYLGIFGTVMNIILIPVKILMALFMWLNFFTMRYTGESLTTNNNNGTKAKKKSKEEVFIEGNLIRAEENQRLNERKGEKYAGIIPHNWELMKRTPEGEMHLVKKGVLAFDVKEDGSIVYSNGKYIIRLLNQEEEKIADVGLVMDIKVIN